MGKRERIIELENKVEDLELQVQIHKNRLQRFEEAQEWWLKDNAKLLKENMQYKFQLDLNDAVKKTDEFKQNKSQE